MAIFVTEYQYTKMIFHYHKTPIHYHKQGTGPAIVMLHGFLEGSSMWQKIAAVLSKKNTVLLLDLPGFGQSGMLEKTHTMENMAIMVCELLAFENFQSATLLGHSMGGYVALAFGELFPEKLDKLILLNSSPTPDSAARKENRDRALTIIDKNKAAFITMAIGNLFNTEEKSKYSLAIKGLKNEALHISENGVRAAIKAMRDRKDRRTILKNIPCEKHIIAGKLDLIVPLQDIVRVSKQTNTTLHPIESGHMSWLTNSPEVIALLQGIV
jgi:pimeloyl-ACP methyl ester carboxylesterase